MIRSLILPAFALAAIVTIAACKTDATAAPATGPQPPPSSHGKMCGGVGGIQCEEGQYCSMTGPNHPDKAGTCRPKPEMCNMLYQPVCGEDGKTYPNSCHANRAGTNVAREGACPA